MIDHLCADRFKIIIIWHPKKCNVSNWGKYCMRVTTFSTYIEIHVYIPCGPQYKHIYSSCKSIPINKQVTMWLFEVWKEKEIKKLGSLSGSLTSNHRPPDILAKREHMLIILNYGNMSRAQTSTCNNISNNKKERNRNFCITAVRCASITQTAS